MKTIVILLLSTGAALAQTGQLPPGGGGGAQPLPPKCTATSCLPPDIYGRPGQCTTIEVQCPVIPPPAPTCMDAFGRVVPCPAR